MQHLNPRRTLRSWLLSKPALALCSLVLAAAVLLPYAWTLPQHADEAQYGWSADYYGRKLLSFDFSPAGGDLVVDPGWSPDSWWALTQPMGTRAVYALALAVTGAPVPSVPYVYIGNADGTGADQPDHLLAPTALYSLRLAAVTCAALGFALITLRLGWQGLLVTVLMLAIPHVRADLARAWAEGPLLLGLGLCVLSFGSRWFVLACALAATFKLTGLITWPLAFKFAPLGRSRLAHLAALLGTAFTWSVLTPPSWYAGGPGYLLMMLIDRTAEYRGQSIAHGGPFGLFLASRYFLPLELALALGLALALPRLWPAARTRLRAMRPRWSTSNIEAPLR